MRLALFQQSPLFLCRDVLRKKPAPDFCHGITLPSGADPSHREDCSFGIIGSLLHPGASGAAAAGGTRPARGAADGLAILECLLALRYASHELVIADCAQRCHALENPIRNETPL